MPVGDKEKGRPSQGVKLEPRDQTHTGRTGERLLVIQHPSRLDNEWAVGKAADEDPEHMAIIRRAVGEESQDGKLS